ARILSFSLTVSSLGVALFLSTACHAASICKNASDASTIKSAATKAATVTPTALAGCVNLPRSMRPVYRARSTGQTFSPQFSLQQPLVVHHKGIFTLKHVARIWQEIFGGHEVTCCVIYESMKCFECCFLFFEIDYVALELRCAT